MGPSPSCARSVSRFADRGRRGGGGPGGPRAECGLHRAAPARLHDSLSGCAQPLPLVLPVPSVVTAAPPAPLTVAPGECPVGLGGGEDAAGGLLAVAAVLWVAVALWTGLLLGFLALWWGAESLLGDGTVETDCTVALSC